MMWQGGLLPHTWGKRLRIMGQKAHNIDTNISAILQLLSTYFEKWRNLFLFNKNNIQTIYFKIQKQNHLKKVQILKALKEIP